MNSDNTSNIFICSFCEQAIRFPIEQEGVRSQCPKCKKTIWVYDNRTSSIEFNLSSTWVYEQPKRFGILGTRSAGPFSDTEFLGLIARGNIDRDTLVQSPEITQNQKVAASRINVPLIREMSEQRAAEIHRVRNLQIRESEQAAKNREILLQGIKKAVADGNLSLNERTQLHSFASKTGISDSEVETLLQAESANLLNQVVDDVLTDGFLDDQEYEKISRIAIGLGLSLNFSPGQRFQLELARFAWNLFEQLQSNNLPKTLACASIEFH